MALMGTVRITFAAIVLMAFVTATAQADQIFISIKGVKQGTFKGEVLQKGAESKIAGLKVRYEVVQPRDFVTGMLTKKRQHNPVVLTKEWGASSPQLFQALVGNEVLSEVVIDFVGIDPKGMLALTHSFKLTNASIAGISHSTEPIAAGGVRHLEDISLVFQKIEMVDVQGKTMAMDDRTLP